MRHTFTLLLLAGTVGVTGQSLTDSLIAHFPMDGNADDVVGGLFPIDTTGSPGFCTGHDGTSNGAGCFDGTGVWSYGDVLDVDTADFTIAFWCRVDALTPASPHHDYPLAKGTTAFGMPEHSGYAFGFRDDLPDTLSAAFLRRDDLNDLQVTSYPTLYSVWRHLLVNRCDTTLTFTIDGVQVDIDTLTMDLDFSTNIYFSIGAGDRTPGGSITGYFQGAVDDIRIYKGRCLGQDEIEALAGLTVGNYEREAPLADLQLYPNPAHSTVRIELSARSPITGPLTLLNALGQVVALPASSMLLDRDRIRSITLDVSGLPAGAYFVVMPTEQGRLYGRFVKE